MGGEVKQANLAEGMKIRWRKGRHAGDVAKIRRVTLHRVEIETLVGAHHRVGGVWTLPIGQVLVNAEIA